MAIVLPGKRHLPIAKVEQAVIGDCHPMRVSAKVLQDLLGAAKWWFGVNNPFGVLGRCQVFCKGDSIAQAIQRVEESEFTAIKGLSQQFKKQAPKQPGQNPHWQEEARLARYPLLRLQRQPSAGHDAVQMRVMQQVLAPRMQYCNKAHLSAKMLRISRYGAQRLGGGLEQDVVDHSLVLKRDGCDFLWDGEDHVEVFDRQKFSLTILKPLVTRERLALWTMPISATVV
jgi:hypothetical protein